MALTVTFRIDFQLSNSPKDLKWTDTTDYASEGLAVNNMSILLWIKDGNGTTIHKNAGWGTNDFSSPDITRSVQAYKDSIELDVDANDNPPSGIWYFYCKVKDSSTSIVYSGSNTYAYAYTQPTVDIDQSYSCRTSELTSTDSTDYVVDSITPSITRAHDIQEPSGSGANDPGSTTASSRTIGGGSTPATRLWTGDWVTSVTSTLSYSMETWVGNDWIVISDSISGSSTISVSCDDCIEDLQTCITAFFDRWKSAKTSDPKEANRLEPIVTEVLTLIEEYNNAERNGGDYAAIAGEIATLLSKEGFTCTTSSSTSVQIVPWGEGSLGTTGSTITFVSSAPTGGNSGDSAIGEDGSAIAWNVYYNSSGTWLLKGNLNAENAPLLSNSISDILSTVTTSEEDLKSYVLAADTLASTGDQLKITALFYVNSGSSIGMELKLYFGSTKVSSYTMVNSINGYYKVKAIVTRTGASAEFYEGSSELYGDADQKISSSPTTAAEDLTSSVTIKASSQKTVNGAGGDITCKYLKVEKIS